MGGPPKRFLTGWLLPLPAGPISRNAADPTAVPETAELQPPHSAGRRQVTERITRWQLPTWAARAKRHQ